MGSGTWGVETHTLSVDGHAAIATLVPGATLAPAGRIVEELRVVKDEEEIDDSEMYVLSDRESEILDLVAQGMRNKESVIPGAVVSG